MKKQIIALGAALGLVAAVGVGSTLAYLTDTTDAVTNTFTVGKVDITLTETSAPSQGVKVGTPVEEDGKLVGYKYDNLLPGDVVSKNVDVKIEAGSAACYVFVKVTGADTRYEYSIVSDWTPLTVEANVYYREEAEVAADAEARVLDVIDTVKLKSEVTEQAGQEFNIVVDAAAVQKANVTSVADAYELVKASFEN